MPSLREHGPGLTLDLTHKRSSPWNQPQVDPNSCWAWTLEPRACGRHSSTFTVERSPSVSRRSRRHIPSPRGPSKSHSSGGRPLGDAVRRALAQGNVDPDQIAGIGLDCTACTVLACDRDGQPLRPAFLWMDQRAFHEADEISGTADPILRYVSGRVSPEWMLPKALWLKRNEPEVYERAARIVECTDWMMFRLTGEWTLSLNHVAVKWNYARPDGGWPVGLLKAVGLVDLLEKWPTRIVPLGKGDSRLSERAARELGLRAGTPVAQGGIDAYLGMLGLGATRDGDVAVIVGSSTCHLAQSREGSSARERPAAIPTPPSRGFTRSRPVKPPRARFSTGTAGTLPATSSKRPSNEAFMSIRCSMSGPPPCRRALRDWWCATTGRGTARRTRTRRPEARSPVYRWRTVPATSSARSTRRPPAAPGTSSKTRRPMA